LVRPYRVTFATALFGPTDRDASTRAFAAMLAALQRIDANYLRSRGAGRGGVPPIAGSGVRYLEAPLGQDTLQDIPTSIALGTVDGSDYAAWRAAEIEVRERVRAVVRPTPQAALGVYRLEVVRADGRVEGPWVARGVGLDKDGEPTGRVTYALNLFNGAANRPLSTLALDALLDALTLIDVDYFRAHPEAPGVMEAIRARLVHYMEEPPGQEDFQDWPTCLRMGIYDCEDGGSALAAQRIVRDRLPARAVADAYPRSDGSALYHVRTRVRTPRGIRTEDPSVAGGMR